MKPWVTLGRAKVPGGVGELRLMQRDAEFAIMLDRAELMNSRRAGSEEALATLACARLRDRQKAHILIGGLGMGFTLRAALAGLGPKARITVAELVPEVVCLLYTSDAADDLRRQPDRQAGCYPRSRCRDADAGGQPHLRCDPARRRQRARRPEPPGQ